MYVLIGILVIALITVSVFLIKLHKEKQDRIFYSSFHRDNDYLI